MFEMNASLRSTPKRVETRHGKGGESNLDSHRRGPHTEVMSHPRDSRTGPKTTRAWWSSMGLMKTMTRNRGQRTLIPSGTIAKSAIQDENATSRCVGIALNTTAGTALRR
jgi:hypothetical protein